MIFKYAILMPTQTEFSTFA